MARFTMDEIRNLITSIMHKIEYDGLNRYIRWHLQQSLEQLFSRVPSKTFWEIIEYVGSGEASIGAGVSSFGSTDILASLVFNYSDEVAPMSGPDYVCNFLMVFYLKTAQIDECLKAYSNGKLVARPIEWADLSTKLNTYTDSCKVDEGFPVDLKFLYSFMAATEMFPSATFSEVLDLHPDEGDHAMALLVHIPDGHSILIIHDATAFAAVDRQLAMMETVTSDTRH